jgi:hypothetical protein
MDAPVDEKGWVFLYDIKTLKKYCPQMNANERKKIKNTSGSYAHVLETIKYMYL